MSEQEKIERHPLTWQTVEGWARARLDEARNALEQPQSPDEADRLRGACRTLRALLALGEAVPTRDVGRLPTDERGIGYGV